MEKQIAPMVEIASMMCPRVDGRRTTNGVHQSLVYPDGQVGVDFCIADPKNAYKQLLAYMRTLNGNTSWDIFGHCIYALFQLCQALERNHHIYAGGWSSKPIVQVNRLNTHMPNELDEHFWSYNSCCGDSG